LVYMWEILNSIRRVKNKVMVKVKITPEQTMKVQRGSRGIDLL